MRAALALSLLLWSQLAVADNKNVEQIVYALPVLSPQRVVELAKKYLVEQKRIDIKKYRLARVNFDFYTNSNRPKGVPQYGWTVAFDTAIPSPPDSDLLIGVSNDRIPKFLVYPL